MGKAAFPRKNSVGVFCRRFAKTRRAERPQAAGTASGCTVFSYEIASGRSDWKVYGPDLNGRFGGLNGTGGLEATILNTGGTAKGVVSDAFGNGVATVTGSTVTWLPTRVGAYGPLPNIRAEVLTDITRVAEATAWRGRRIDPTGFYNLGARPYDPTTGRFISADPLGHAASMSLYDYANGDPVNFFDADGRAPADEAFHAYNEPAANNAPLRLTVANVAAVVLDAIGKTAMSASLIGSQQFEPGSDRSQVINAGYQIARTNAGQATGVDVNNPRFELASTAVSVIGTYGVLSAVSPRTVISEQPMRALTPEEAATYQRPTSFRLGVREDTWAQAQSPNGKVYDSSGMEIKPSDPWEMGHLPEYQLALWQRTAADQNWTRQQWLDFQNDPGIYRPELPWSNMSHAFEFGDWQNALALIREPYKVPIWPAVGFGSKCGSQ